MCNLLPWLTTIVLIQLLLTIQQWLPELYHFSNLSYNMKIELSECIT